MRLMPRKRLLLPLLFLVVSLLYLLYLLLSSNTIVGRLLFGLACFVFLGTIVDAAYRSGRRNRLITVLRTVYLYVAGFLLGLYYVFKPFKVVLITYMILVLLTQILVLAIALTLRIRLSPITAIIVSLSLPILILAWAYLHERFSSLDFLA